MFLDRGAGKVYPLWANHRKRRMMPKMEEGMDRLGNMDEIVLPMELMAGTHGSSNGGCGRMDMRRSGGMDLCDPKDRICKEPGIVLSLQKRSFNMGCQMPAGLLLLLLSDADSSIWCTKRSSLGLRAILVRSTVWPASGWNELSGGW